MLSFYIIVANFFSNGFKTILSVLYLLIKSKYFPGVIYLKRENNSESCFVIGNGPSFKKDCDGKIEYLSKQTLFVVNHFSQSDLFEILKPKFYIFADSAYWERDKLKNYESKKDIENTLLSIKNKTDWNLFLLVPVEASNFFNKYFITNKNIKIIDYNKTAIDGFRFFKFWVYNKNLSMPPAQTVVNAAIFIAINIGFEEINLLGVDHSWHKNLFVRNDNVLCFLDDHFYDEKLPVPIPLKGYNIGDKARRIHEELYDAARAFETHHQINDYAKRRMVKIYNRSSITYIDAYERRPFNESC